MLSHLHVITPQLLGQNFNKLTCRRMLHPTQLRRHVCIEAPMDFTNGLYSRGRAFYSSLINPLLNSYMSLGLQL